MSSSFASTSTLPSLETIPLIRPRKTRRLRLAPEVIPFVLALCVPYVEASPVALPSQDRVMGPSLAARMTSHILPRIFPADGPKVSLLRMNEKGMYAVPVGYVVLQQRFQGGFIVLSYAIAFIGSLCTLELLVRRTNNAGWRNRILLTSAGICFGGVSTFAMHFIFNNSLTLHHPLQDIRDYPSLHLQYDAGYTILSLVASILAMTLAFFIMGTDLHDWWCYPGRRSKRAAKRKRSHGDEYGRWKSEHKLDKRDMSVGALLSQVGRIAQWSMMDTGKDAKPWGQTKQGKSWNEGQNDGELDEMDFRLGRRAVDTELERRRNSIASTSGNSRSLRLQPNDPSLLITPEPIAQSTYTRRGSLPLELPNSATSLMFTPGYDFPPRDQSLNSSTTALIPTSPMPWSRIPIDHEIPDPWSRRPSLPAALIPVQREYPMIRAQPNQALARIQSAVEGDSESPIIMRSRAGSEDKKPTSSPSLVVSAQLNHLDVETHSMTPAKKHTRRKALNAIERFIGFDVVTRTDVVKIVITGSIAGFGVAAMHYIGQLSITGMPYIAYRAEYVVASVIIASSAVVIALYIMFIMLRPKLKHTIWSKLAVAAILAAAVCLMHFTGMEGTVYAWPRGHPILESSLLTGTNVAITGIVVALAVAACIVCAVFFAVSSWKLKLERRRRRRVVVAAVFLDQHDRILVNSTDGMLPMCDITSVSSEIKTNSSKKSSTTSISTETSVLGMDLTPAHDAFVSALKMTWSWRSGSTPSTTSLSQEAIKNQTLIGTTAADIRRGSHATTTSSTFDNRPMRLSISRFLEMFAGAAGQLAVRVTGHSEGVMRLGVLYDQILTTGWVKLQKSNDTVSKGQLIFLVRRVTSPEERSDLEARHFIFADSTAVSSTLHKTLSVPLDHTTPLLKDIVLWADSTAKPTLKANTLYTGIAVVQATPFDGLRILLEQDNRAQLPIRELCTFAKFGEEASLYGTLEELGEAITWLDGMSLLSVITRNMTVEGEQIGGPRVSRLLSALERAIIPMLDGMLTPEDMAHILPRLILHPVLVPLTPGSVASTKRGYTAPHMIVFYANYDAAVNTFTDKWLSFSLFRAQNACVMATSIAAASKFEVISAPVDHPDGFNPARRPSRVQFDFAPNPISAVLPLSNNTQPQQIETLSPATEKENPFTFPPHQDDPSSRGRGPLAAIIQSSPRRSSLAKVSRFDTPPAAEEVLSPTSSFPFPQNNSLLQGTPAPVGIAEWDPDWLLVLLRTRLTSAV